RLEPILPLSGRYTGRRDDTPEARVDRPSRRPPAARYTAGQSTSPRRSASHGAGSTAGRSARKGKKGRLHRLTTAATLPPRSNERVKAVRWCEPCWDGFVRDLGSAALFTRRGI